jgi:hypothetical protein
MSRVNPHKHHWIAIEWDTTQEHNLERPELPYKNTQVIEVWCPTCDTKKVVPRERAKDDE